MGKVERRGEVWTTRVSLTDRDTGRRIQKRVTARTKRELDDEVARVRAEFGQRGYVDVGRVRLADWIATWLESYRQSGSSVAQRRIVFEVHVRDDDLGRVMLGRLTTGHVQAFVDRKAAEGYSRSYLASMVQVVRLALRAALRRGLVREDVCAGVVLPGSGRAVHRVWSVDEVRRFLALVAGDELEALYTLAVVLGLRRGELLALRWSDVDLEAGTLRVERTLTRAPVTRASGRTGTVWTLGEMGKTAAARRTLVLPELCAQALRVHRARPRALDSVFVFPAGDGGYLSSSTVWHRYDVLLARSDLPRIRFHELRHTAASQMLRAGVPVVTVARILGHASPAVTYGRYSHVITGMMDEAAVTIERIYG